MSAGREHAVLRTMLIVFHAHLLDALLETPTTLVLVEVVTRPQAEGVPVPKHAEPQLAAKTKEGAQLRMLALRLKLLLLLDARSRRGGARRGDVDGAEEMVGGIVVRVSLDR